MKIKCIVETLKSETRLYLCNVKLFWFLIRFFFDKIFFVNFTPPLFTLILEAALDNDGVFISYEFRAL